MLNINSPVKYFKTSMDSLDMCSLNLKKFKISVADEFLLILFKLIISLYFFNIFFCPIFKSVFSKSDSKYVFGLSIPIEFNFFIKSSKVGFSFNFFFFSFSIICFIVLA